VKASLFCSGLVLGMLAAAVLQSRAIDHMITYLQIDRSCKADQARPGVR
jgi:hypothetical protein